MMDKLAAKLNKPALNKLKIEKFTRYLSTIYMFNLDIKSKTELIFD